MVYVKITDFQKLSILKIAQYAQFQDDDHLDCMVRDFLRETLIMKNVLKPETDDLKTLVICASLVELFALRRDEPSPQWTAEIGPLDKPFYLSTGAMTSKWFQDWCREHSPEPLKKRNLYATDNYLFFPTFFKHL
jgi:hypothetical protein